SPGKGTATPGWRAHEDDEPAWPGSTTPAPPGTWRPGFHETLAPWPSSWPPRGTRMRTSLLPMLPLLLAACTGAGVQTDATPRLVTGDWGGAHAALRLRPDGGTIEYDC